MCAIAAILKSKRPKEEREQIVQKMLDIQSHRAPDGNAMMSGDDFTLGHGRLSIMDPKNSLQPLAGERFAISFSGEIYNHPELREFLSKREVKPRTGTDTEVLLNWLSADQPLSRLRGMYAAVIVEIKTGHFQGRRDPFGIKPLYFANTPTGDYVIATEIKALFQHPEISPQIDPIGLRQYECLQFCLGERTMFKGISQVPCDPMPDVPGEWMLQESVKMHEQGDFPVATYCSGGIDSSAITAFASGNRAYHGRFKEEDESKYAWAVTDKWKKRLSLFQFDTNELLCDIDRLTWHLDYPDMGPGVLPQFALARNLSKKFRVVLSGTGGDEFFAGYGRYWATTLTSHPWATQFRPLLESMNAGGLLDELPQRYFRTINRGPYDEEVYQAFEEEFKIPNASTDLQRIKMFEVRNQLRGLLHVEDRVSSAFGVEARTPFLLPEIYHLGMQDETLGKQRLKYYLREILPKSVLDRTDKMGFNVPGLNRAQWRNICLESWKRVWKLG